MQSQVVDRLKDKLHDLEVNLEREKEAYSQIQVSFQASQSTNDDS